MNSPIQSWRQQKITRGLLSKTGKIITWTKIYVSTAEYKAYTPYPVVLVEFEGGERAYGQLVDFEEKDVKIGNKVISILRILHKGSAEDIVEYGLKFRPI